MDAQVAIHIDQRPSAICSQVFMDHGTPPKATEDFTPADEGKRVAAKSTKEQEICLGLGCVLQRISLKIERFRLEIRVLVNDLEFEFVKHFGHPGGPGYLS